MTRVTIPEIPGSFFCHNICHNKNPKIFQFSSLSTRLKILVSPSLTNRKIFWLFVTHEVVQSHLLYLYVIWINLSLNELPGNLFEASGLYVIVMVV